MNLPNSLTLSRVFSIPLLVWVLSTDRISGDGGTRELAASVVFVLAAITDRFDGYLARKRGQVTALGMLLDPLADKLFIASAFIALVQFNPRLVKAWMVVVIISREFLVSGLRTLAANERFTIQASDLGKMKMAAQVVAVEAAILAHRWVEPEFASGRFHFVLGIDLIANLSIWYMVALSIISAADYFLAFWKKIDRTASRHRRLHSAPARPR